LRANDVPETQPDIEDALMKMESLRDLYIEELKDLYSAEKQLVKALPKMVDNASNPELKEAFTNHLEQTKGHVDRIEQIFKTLDASPSGKKCVGMEGLIEEANELIKEDAEDDVLDAGLISKAQHVEHYEMAGYGTVRTYALILGENEHASLLQQTLDEETETDKLLTRVAEGTVNTDALVDDREVSRPMASEQRRVASDSSSRAARSDDATAR
jgi:ferritin-like metal-binding protein YciE